MGRSCAQAETHERFYGFVTAVDKDKAAITAGLQATTNETKTMGTRHTGPARAAGEGVGGTRRLRCGPDPEY